MNRRGFTLIEVLMAIVILGIVLLSTGRFTAQFIHSTAIAQVNAVASEVASEQLELIATDPSYGTLAARWGGSTTVGFPGYAQMRRETTIQRVIGVNPRRDYTVVTVRVTEPTMPAPVRLTTIVGQP